MGFIILPYEGEDAWLQQRQKVVTATDVAKILAFPANRGQVTKLPRVPQQQVC